MPKRRYTPLTIPMLSSHRNYSSSSSLSSSSSSSAPPQSLTNAYTLRRFTSRTPSASGFPASRINAPNRSLPSLSSSADACRARIPCTFSRGSEAAVVLRRLEAWVVVEGSEEGMAAARMGV